MCDLEHDDEQHVVVQLVDHAVVADADAVLLVLAAELGDTGWAGVLGQGQDLGVDAAPDFRRQAASCRSACELIWTA